MKYLEFFKKLNDENIDFLIVGGFALLIYGSPRFTYDIDIVLKLEDENIKKFINIMLEMGYKVKIPIDPMDFAIKEKREEWIRNKNMKAFNFYNDSSALPEVDIVIDTTDFNVLNISKKIFFVDNISLPVPAIKDLIDMKKKANRPVDYEDIEFLKYLEQTNV